MKKAIIGGLLAALAVAALPAHAAPSALYTAGGTTVVRVNGEAVVDNGALVCDPDGTSIGGGCLDFGGEPGTAQKAGVAVDDGEMGGDVAFQVCIDNNGDSICGGPQGNAELPCGDDQFFSHADDGRFFNPLGPLPTSFRRECPGGPWRGYVVFLCTGVHEAEGSDPHAHRASGGTMVTTDEATGYGNFCGGGGIRGATGDLIAKAYRVV